MHLHFVHCEILDVKHWNINKKYTFKRVFGCITIVEFVLYVLFATQGHLAWESIVNTLTMQIVPS